MMARLKGVISALFLTLGLLLLSIKSQAQWVESTGSAEIRSGNKAAAKNQAVQDALKQALIFAGASVSSVQQVTNGLLTQDNFQITAHGSIQQLELVEEQTQQGILSVTIRADIIPEEKQCFSADFRKSLAVTQFSLQNHGQGKIGGLYQIGKYFSQRLFQQLQLESDSILPRPWLQQKIDSRASFAQYYDQDLKIIDTIGQASESQFVLLGEITDLSFGQQTSNNLAFWQSKQSERFFALDVVLYDTGSKEQIFRQQFDTVANWPHGKGKIGNIPGKRFWQSGYGMAIDALIGDLQMALEAQIHCQPVQGKIVKINDNQIQFNLGAAHGVSKGQLFSIIHQSHFTTESGKHLPHFIISPYQVKVVEVYNKTSVANSVDDQLLGNIQTTDMVILKELPEVGFD